MQPSHKDWNQSNGSVGRDWALTTLNPKFDPSFYDTSSREFEGLPTLEDPWFTYFMQRQEYQKVIVMTNPCLHCHMTIDELEIDNVKKWHDMRTSSHRDPPSHMGSSLKQNTEISLAHCISASSYHTSPRTWKHTGFPAYVFQQHSPSPSSWKVLQLLSC